MMRNPGAYLMSACALWLLWMSSAFAAGNSADSADIRYLVGLQNSEDILRIGATRWLLASGLVSWKKDPNSHGHLYLVNRLDASFEVLFPSSHPVLRQDKHRFPDCPGPLNPANFSAHGLALQQTASGRFRMYMTSHGEREAIEAFDIDARGAKPVLL